MLINFSFLSLTTFRFFFFNSYCEFETVVNGCLKGFLSQLVPDDDDDDDDGFAT